jgi:singapore isolate B (sub-type 7) whole genome shotgun sequence assembly, scaffold_6
MSNINMNNLNNINNTINNTMRDSTNTNTNTNSNTTNTNSNTNNTNTINTITINTKTTNTNTNTTITNTTITNTLLSPCQWQYPDDALYVKLFILSPLAALEAALGPRHSFGDRPRNPSPFSRIGPEFSQWTFAFTDPATQKSSRFQLRGHGVDKRSRLHDIRHVLMGETPDDRREHLLWSLRFDARFTRLLFRGNLEILSL